MHDSDYRSWDDDSDEPITDGPRRGQRINYDGMAAYVVRDDGVQWMHVRMVGDDALHKEDRDDYTELLGELDYCAECGQVGCGHDGRDRSEVET